MPTVCSIFTPMEAKYTHLDSSLPWYHLFDNNYNHEYVYLYTMYINTVDASKIIWSLLSHKL